MMTWPVIALAALGGMLISLGCVLTWLYRRGRLTAVTRTDANAALVEELRAEVKMLTATSVGMGHRLDRVIADLRELAERQERHESRDTGAAGSYLHAIRMAERGKGVEELMDVFGVSRAEAELLRKLHPEQKVAARH